MGLEIIEQVPDVDAVVIPVGGGGLIAGCAVALKTMNPKIKIIVRNWLIIICFNQFSVYRLYRHCLQSSVQYLVQKEFLQKQSKRNIFV